MLTRRVNPPTWFLALLIGCRQAPPSPDGDGDVPPDLPCGGADLNADNFNCGACENECAVFYEGTNYEAGGCIGGKCGPVWHATQYEPMQIDGPPPPDLTCAELCADYSTSCADQGCSGKTGYVCSTLFGYGCSLHDDQALLDWTGTCNEVIPWPEFFPGDMPMVGCCCWRADPPPS
jgi:hypothetical protein